MPTNRSFTAKAQSERLEFALQASYELEVVGRHVNRELQMEGPDYMHLRALAVRIVNLNSVVMSVLGGEDVLKTEDIQKLLEGY